MRELSYFCEVCGNSSTLKTCEMCQPSKAQESIFTLTSCAKRCKNDKCKRILSDRGKPNKSGFCSNCFRQDPKNKEKWLKQQKKWREKRKKQEKLNIKNKNEEK